jgi:adenylyl-sulfate kinase
MSTTAQKGFTLWFTGLSGAGKSTLSTPVAERLRALGHRVEVLDGDVVRTNLSKGLGFSKEDRDTNIRRIGFVANLLSRNGVVAITAAISPYREIRDEIRGMVTGDGGGFVEVFVKCPIDVLALRGAALARGRHRVRQGDRRRQRREDPRPPARARLPQ